MIIGWYQEKMSVSWFHFIYLFFFIKTSSVEYVNLLTDEVDVMLMIKSLYKYIFFHL